MEEEKERTQPKEVCTIRIMFPVDTDEQAIVYKKKIADILADIPQARFEFSLSNLSR